MPADLRRPPNSSVPEPHPDDELALLAAGALPAAEVADVEAHLRRCGRCTGELAELVRLTDLLPDPEEDAVAAPPPGLGDRVVRAVARERRRESRLVLARRSVAAAAAAVALLGVGTLLPRGFDAPRERIELVAADDAVDVRGALVAHTWGTELEMTVTGLPAGAAYDVVLVDDGGQRYDAGAFLGVAGREVVCEMNAAVLRPDVERVVVQDAAGEVVLEASV